VQQDQDVRTIPFFARDKLKKKSALEEPINGEDQLFKSLSNENRRSILRVIGERQEATFTEIKLAIGSDDSPSLSYHLNALEPLLKQKNGKYRLSELGQETYHLLSRVTASTTSTRLLRSLKKEISAVIIANALLWAAAILAVAGFEGRLQQMTLFSFAALWFTSNIILYSILVRMRI
jgi:DNA-binding transcriptional ArsR family regulator